MIRDVKRKFYRRFKLGPYKEQPYYHIDMEIDLNKPKVNITAKNMDWKEVITVAIVLVAAVAIVYVIKH